MIRHRLAGIPAGLDARVRGRMRYDGKDRSARVSLRRCDVFAAGSAAARGEDA